MAVGKKGFKKFFFLNGKATKKMYLPSFEYAEYIYKIRINFDLWEDWMNYFFEPEIVMEHENPKEKI